MCETRPPSGKRKLPSIRPELSELRAKIPPRQKAWLTDRAAALQISVSELLRRILDTPAVQAVGKDVLSI